MKCPINTQSSSVGAEAEAAPKKRLPPLDVTALAVADRRKLLSLFCRRALTPPGRERKLLTRRIYYVLNPSKCRKWDWEHRDLVHQRSRNWYLANKERNKQRTYRNRARNLDAHRASVAKWHRDHAKQRLEYRKRFRKTHPFFVLTDRVRRRINRALASAGAKKASGSISMLGCSGAELRIHLERLFLPGMSWENRRLWHVDHIRPLASFQLRDPAQQRQAFHFSNLQPLWAEDNRRKGKKNPADPHRSTGTAFNCRMTI